MLGVGASITAHHCMTSLSKLPQGGMGHEEIWKVARWEFMHMSPISSSSLVCSLRPSSWWLCTFLSSGALEQASEVTITLWMMWVSFPC